MLTWLSSLRPNQPAVFGVIAATVVLTVAALSGGVLYVRAVAALDDEVRDDLRHIAVVAAAAIDPALHARLTEPAQEGGQDYRAALAPLQRIRAESPRIRFIYTCVLRNGMVHFVLDPTPPGDADHDGVEDHSALMDPYAEANPVLKSVFTTGVVATDAEPVADRWGVTFSAYAPFRDRNGTVAGVVGVDLDVAVYHQRLAALSSPALLGATLALLSAIGVGVGVGMLLGSMRRALISNSERECQIESARIQAELANHAKGEFLAMMSHEIRTPLNAVIGLADLLHAGVPAAQQARHISTIRSSGEHLLTVISDILDYAKIEAGRMELEHVAFSPRQVAEEALRMMEAPAQAKGLELKLITGNDLASAVVGDPVRLRQVLLNLLSNAIKFTAVGGASVRLSTSAPEGTPVSLIVAVSDTGPGMSDSSRTRLFQPYMQGDSSVSRRHGGTGLGLVICQELVRLMGGAIKVTSVLGTGSTFSFTLSLPRAEAAVAHTPSGAWPIGAPRLRGRVLVVDDNDINRSVAAALLERLGITAETASGGRAALDRLARDGIDLVLMDSQMPELDGIATTAEWRRREAPGRRIPVIALTASVLRGEESRCRAAGMDGYLMKPVRLDALMGELGKWLPMSEPGSESRLPPQAPTGDAGAVLDPATVYLLRSLDADPSAFATLIDGYLTEATGQVAALGQMAADGRLMELAEMSHAQKGAALTMGLMPLAAAFQAAEQIARAGERAGLDAAIAAVRHQFARAAAALVAAKG